MRSSHRLRARLRSGLRDVLDVPVATQPSVVPPPPPPPQSDRSTYLAAATLSERYAGAGTVPADLTRAELKVLSQNGEDGVLAEIFRRIGLPDAPTFVEFGIETGTQGNCVFLADLLGWRGLFIEPDPTHFRALSAKYAGNDAVRTVQAAVTPGNVDRLFDAAGLPPEPDVVSIDIDGVDYWVWRALVRHRPRVIVIEYNASLGFDDALTVPEDHGGWDGVDYFGASLRALERLGAAKGYALVHTEMAGVNAFFVRDRPDAFPEPPRLHGPNYFLQALAHAPDPTRRPWVRDPPT